VTVVLLAWLKERKAADRRAADRSAELQVGPSADSPLPSPFTLPPGLVRYLIVLSIFTLGNSADAFLLLRLTEAAGGPQLIPLFWSLLHVVKMGASLAGGTASDIFGRRPLIAAGWTVYAIVYAGFAVSTSLWALLTWFFVYGIYYGCVEGTERALVADFANPAQRGTAFGIYNAVAGVGALVSSVVFGLIWHTFGAATAFASGAALAIAAAVLLFVLVPAPADNSGI
jgi:MFS family permease